MYTADSGNRGQLYLAISMDVAFSWDTPEPVLRFDLLRIEMMTNCLPYMHLLPCPASETEVKLSCRATVLF